MGGILWRYLLAITIGEMEFNKNERNHWKLRRSREYNCVNGFDLTQSLRIPAKKHTIAIVLYFLISGSQFDQTKNKDLVLFAIKQNYSLFQEFGTYCQTLKKESETNLKVINEARQKRDYR